MNVVEVDTRGSYPIHIGPGRLDRLDQCIPADATAIAVVTNPTVAALYGDRAEAALARTGKRVLRIELPDGESYKDWQSLNLIFDALLSQRLDRRCMLVALGGGVIGDMTGFAAAVYMRGVRFLQVPTTLLAQVDSSVGGKTAVNHPLGKNMIGAFYQPVAVEIDTDVLNTLPAREVSAGLAEVIKYGLILDPEFWAWCELNAPKLRARWIRRRDLRHPPLLRAEGAGGGQGRTRVRPARHPEPGPHLRPRHRGGLATAPGCTARPWAAAWCRRPSCRPMWRALRAPTSRACARWSKASAARSPRPTWAPTAGWT